MEKDLIVKGTQEFLGKEIPVIEGGFGENKKVILAKTVAEIHETELSKINVLINNNIEKFEIGIDLLDLCDKDFKVQAKNLGLITSNRQKYCYILSETGYIKLANIKKDKNIKIAKDMLTEYFGTKEDFIILSTRKEIRFREKLKEVLSAFHINDIEFQKSIQNKKGTNYKIDCYIPSLNIAIEYDENGHANYTYEAHEGRQKEIEKELGCKFIRVTDKESDEYNIGLVIKELFNITVVS